MGVHSWVLAESWGVWVDAAWMGNHRLMWRKLHGREEVKLELYFKRFLRQSGG